MTIKEEIYNNLKVYNIKEHQNIKKNEEEHQNIKKNEKEQTTLLQKPILKKKKFNVGISLKKLWGATIFPDKIKCCRLI